MGLNTPVSSYDRPRVSSLCRCSSVSEARKIFVYVNGTASKYTYFIVFNFEYVDEIIFTCGNLS